MRAWTALSGPNPVLNLSIADSNDRNFREYMHKIQSLSILLPLLSGNLVLNLSIADSND
jgi:hypothetical protein